MPNYGIKIRNAAGNVILDSSAVGWTAIDNFTVTGDKTNATRTINGLPEGITTADIKAVHTYDLNDAGLFTNWGFAYVDFDYSVSLTGTPTLTYSLTLEYFPIYGNTLDQAYVDTTITIFVK